MRWPLMFRKTHEAEMAVLSEAAADAVGKEYARAVS